MKYKTRKFKIRGYKVKEFINGKCELKLNVDVWNPKYNKRQLDMMRSEIWAM